MPVPTRIISWLMPLSRLEKLREIKMEKTDTSRMQTRAMLRLNRMMSENPANRISLGMSRQTFQFKSAI